MYLVFLLIAFLLALLALVAFLTVFLIKLRRSALAMIQTLQDQGVDPDRALLRVVARQQGQEKGRRGLSGWVAMRYILWVRRGVKDPNSSTRGRKP